MNHLFDSGLIAVRNRQLISSRDSRPVHHLKNSKFAKIDTTFAEDCEIESKFALLLLSDSVWGVALSKQLAVSSSCPVQQKKMVGRCASMRRTRNVFPNMPILAEAFT